MRKTGTDIWSVSIVILKLLSKIRSCYTKVRLCITHCTQCNVVLCICVRSTLLNKVIDVLFLGEANTDKVIRYIKSCVLSSNYFFCQIYLTNLWYLWDNYCTWKYWFDRLPTRYFLTSCKFAFSARPKSHSVENPHILCNHFSRKLCEINVLL